MDEQSISRKRHKRLLLRAIVTAIVAIAVVMCVVIYNIPTNRRDRQLKLAQKYMAEMDYENAILAYRATIEIDPKCEDAYTLYFGRN